MPKAKDGLEARLAGDWTEEKLYYVQRYLEAFAKAMGPKRAEGKWKKLSYIDLLAGPGICINRDTGDEFEGSPLRALQIVPSFDRFYFRDINTVTVEVLRQRLPQDRLGKDIDCRCGDCNQAARDIVGELSLGTLSVAFLDPTGLDVHFDTLERLAQRRVDILYLFPSGAIIRNLGSFVDAPNNMDAFWGGSDWRDLLPKLPQREAGEKQIARSWVQAFQSKMENLGFLSPGDVEPLITNDQNAPMFHLLFFSRDPAGLTIWRGIKQIEATGQRRLRWRD